MDRYYETMLNKDFEGPGVETDKSWQLNRKLDAGTNTPEIQQIIDMVNPCLTGQKLPGAGGGGFMLMMAKDEEAAKQTLTYPVNKTSQKT